MGVNGIYGLSGSGIDVESMVKVGMLSKQKEYDKMQQTYTKNEWTKQAYNEIYTKLTTYSTSTLSPYKMSSNMSAKTAVSSNENAVTATPNGNAVVMSHKVSVEQLSSSPYLVATQSLQARNSSAEAGSVKLQDYLFTNGTYNMVDQFIVVSDADGKDIDVNDVNDVAFAFKFSDGTTDDKGVEKTYTFSYTYGDLLGVTKNSAGLLTYTENTEKTFNDFVSDFNAQGSNIKASYDAVGGKFSFYNKYGGEEAKINFELSVEGANVDQETVAQTTATFFQGMKLAQSINGELLAQDADGNLVDFYGTDGSGIVGDNYYIGSGNAGNGTSAALASSEAITYESGDDTLTANASINLAALFDDPSAFKDGFGFSLNGADAITIAYQPPADDADDDAVGTFTYTKFQTAESDSASLFADLIGAEAISYNKRTEAFTYTRNETYDVDAADAADFGGLIGSRYAQTIDTDTVNFNTDTQLFSYDQTQSLAALAQLIGADLIDYDNETGDFTYTINGQTSDEFTTADFQDELANLIKPEYADMIDLDSFEVDGDEGTVTYTAYQTLDGMAELIGAQSVSYDDEADQLSYVMKETTRGAGLDDLRALAGDDTLNYDSETRNFSYVTAAESGELSTVGDLINLINADSGTTKVQASIDNSGIFSLTSTVKGASSAVNITASDDDADTVEEFFAAFNLADANADSYGEDDETEDVEGLVNGLGSHGIASATFSFGITGQYGSVTIDGVKFDKLTDNSVTAYGVTYKLHNTTVDDSGKVQTVGVQVEQDTDAIVDRVKSFVEDYNKLLSSIYDKYDEKQYKDYKPLTASQKEQMKDEQIEKWEEKAKSGLLYHDQTLSKIATKMRDAISQPIEGLTGKYTSVYSLGISTTGIHGQLTLDEDKLRAALDTDSESVYNVFSTLSKDDDFSQNGVAQRLSDVMIDATKLIKERAGTDDSINDDSDLGTLMRNLQNKMSDFKKLLDAFEDKLYKKYDAMEVALSQLGTQLSFITGGQ